MHNLRILLKMQEKMVKDEWKIEFILPKADFELYFLMEFKIKNAKFQCAAKF